MKRVFAATCAVTCVLFSAAYAGGPIVLDDASMDKVTAAGEVIFNTDIDKTVDITKNVNYNITKNVATNVDLDGSLASAEASADSTGWDYNLAETETFAQVTTEGAFSFSDALAAGNFFPEPPIVTPTAD
jgi:hypothetical protein